jgi:hypothetical protein
VQVPLRQKRIKPWQASPSFCPGQQGWPSTPHMTHPLPLQASLEPHLALSWTQLPPLQVPVLSSSVDESLQLIDLLGLQLPERAERLLQLPAQSMVPGLQLVVSQASPMLALHGVSHRLPVHCWPEGQQCPPEQLPLLHPLLAQQI